MQKKSLRYLSICSGIEAATVAWHKLGWEPTAFSEIDKFACAVLSHHYPDVPLHGDFTAITKKDYGAIDLLVGGTPCQAFSIAGLRKGLADDRGNLTLEFIRLAQRKSPRWLVWENVPGVMSIDEGRTFGTFLGGLAECGYGIAYRILDAQYFGVPQRRRRVFVIGYFGDWRPAAAVLFERESLQRDITPRRKAREGITGCLAGSADPHSGQEITDTLTCNGDAHSGFRDEKGLVTIPINTQMATRYDDACNGFGVGNSGDPAFTLLASNSHAIAFQQGWGNAVKIEGGHGDVTGTLAASPGMKQQTYIAFEPGSIARNAGPGLSETCSTLRNEMGDNQPAVITPMAVRRLTPLECERLQGFPDGYTKVPYRGKLAADRPRYKALGNSMAVPVMRWLGERIQEIEGML